MEPKPIPKTALVMVVKDEAPRLRNLLPVVKPWFEQIVIGVQDSTDETLALAEAVTPYVVRDRPRGFGDASFPKVQKLVTEKFSFRLDADETPTRALLESLLVAARFCEDENYGGLWIPFRSWIEDAEWEQPHSHLRYWLSKYEWPPHLHSRPDPHRQHFWSTGFIEHRKSLDEHVTGYLGYLMAGAGNQGWTDHNRLMIRSAVEGTAARKGWADIESREWWPTVLAEIYGGQRPTGPAPVAEP